MTTIKPGDRVTIGTGKTVWRVISVTNGRLVLHSENGTVRWLSITDQQVRKI